MSYIINGLSIKYAIYIVVFIFLLGLFVNFLRGPKLSKEYYEDIDIKDGPIKILKKYDKKLLDDIKIAIADVYYDWTERTLNTGSLKILPIYFFGVKNKNLQNLPYLSSYINNIPDIYSFYFLEMSPKTHIDKNNGWGIYSNDVIRYVFCMQTKSTTIDVETNIKQLKTGQWIIYDMTKMHEIHNICDDSALMMIIDIKRPSNIVNGSNKLTDMTEILNMFDIVAKINN